jgi:hypothetical protein
MRKADQDRARRAAFVALWAVKAWASAATDDEIGMAWWNALTPRERVRWMAVAGNTGRAVDAWEAFKNRNDPFR